MLKRTRFIRTVLLSLALHFIVHRFSQCNSQVSFCSLRKGITPKILMLCFVLINSVQLNLLCVWILLLWTARWTTFVFSLPARIQFTEQLLNQ